MQSNNIFDKSMLEFVKDGRKKSNRKVWTFFGKTLNTDDFYDEIDRVATFLKNNNIGKGKSVAICLPNIPDAIVVTYAVNKIGAVANIIHPLIPAEGLKHVIEKVGSSMLFTFDMFYDKNSDVITKLNIPTIVSKIQDYTNKFIGLCLSIATHSKTKNIEYNDNILRYADIVKTKIENIEDNGKGEDTAVYLHSGGTTGTPKTVILSNRALNALAYKTLNLIGGEFAEDDSMLMVLPLFHGFGLGVCMHTSISGNGKVVLMPNFNAKGAIKLIKKQKVSLIAGVPTMYDKMMNEKSFAGKHLMTLKHCYCGGDKLPEATKVRFDKILKESGNPISINEGYGLTELVSVCTVNTEDDSKFPSVGKGLVGNEFKIVDKKGNSLPPNELGEICVSSDTMMSGYLNDSETTAVTMRSDEIGKMWIHTGDIGYIDEEGFLYFKDRLKRMIKISGMNVFPKEIEEIVESMKEIKFSSAIASELNGKPIIKLFVVMEKGYKFTEKTKEAIRTKISSELMKYSVPKVIVCRDELPLTAVGKVDYKKLQNMENLKG